MVEYYGFFDIDDTCTAESAEFKTPILWEDNEVVVEIRSLIGCNDTARMTFSQIADVIVEKQDELFIPDGDHRIR